MTAQEYFDQHSIDPNFAKEKFEWKFTETEISIPIYDVNGELLFVKTRHLDCEEKKALGDENARKFTNPNGTNATLYCQHAIIKQDTIVLCEGEPDAIRLWQEGVPAVTSTGGVGTFNTKIAEPLKWKNVIICLDTDEAGQSEVAKYYEVLEKCEAKVTIKTLPKEYKDVSEYFTAGNTRDDFLALENLKYDDWLDKTVPEEYKLETVNEILNQDIPVEEWLVERIIPYEGFTFIVGPEATGKTFYTLSLSEAVATGKAWLENTAFNEEGKSLFPVKKAEKVLIIDKENTKRRVQSRMKWMDINSDNIFYLKYPHFFELSDPRQEDGFSKIAKEASRQVKKRNIKLIVVDAFTDVMVGNENAAGDVQGFFDAMRQLFPGTAILVLHHASKPVQGVTRTSAQRARGSTNIMAQVYSAFHVEPLPKSRTEFTFEQTKAGDALKLPKFIVELDVQPIDGSLDKTKVVGIIYKGEVPDEEVKRTKASTLIEESFLSSEMISRQELMDLCLGNNITERTTRRAIKDLIDLNKIDEVPSLDGDKRKKTYIWTGDSKTE